MIMTRDRNGLTEFWTGDNINCISMYHNKMWGSGTCVFITSLIKKDFKKLFVDEPLPRKDSKVYISHLKLVKN